jgi:hypothetical protein
MTNMGNDRAEVTSSGADVGVDDVDGTDGIGTIDEPGVEVGGAHIVEGSRSQIFGTLADRGGGRCAALVARVRRWPPGLRHGDDRAFDRLRAPSFWGDPE